MDDIYLHRNEEEDALFDEMDSESEIFRLIENTLIWTLEKVCNQNWLPLSVYRRPGDPIFSTTIGVAILEIAAEMPMSGIGESFLACYYYSEGKPSAAIRNYIESSAYRWFAEQGFNWISLLMYLGAICHLVMFLCVKKEFLCMDDIVLSVTAVLEDNFVYDIQELGGWKAFEKECDIWMLKYSSCVLTEKMKKKSEAPKHKSIFFVPSLWTDEISSLDEDTLQDQFAGGDMVRILSDLTEKIKNLKI